MQLEEIEFGGVKVDKCFHCEGIWLDKGEIETVQAKEAGFMSRLANVFRK
jgi:Zn-finger nucleic acid-binding protein